jgi:dienelactone hydrolase
LDLKNPGDVDLAKFFAVVANQNISALREKYEKISEFISYRGFNKFFVIGFCWGAWFGFKMSAEYENIVAIVAAHPSFQVEGFFGGTDESLVTNVRSPAWLFVGGNDNPNLKPNGTLTNILTAKFGS